eukprot:Hpha_TRINITY_DN15936_c4_g1::TRINITY_DN15936_c4_g1_i1::g.75152::m.75152
MLRRGLCTARLPRRVQIAGPRWASGSAEWHRKVLKFYQKHNPSKLEGEEDSKRLPAAVVDLLEKHKGKEERVWKILVEKYGAKEEEAEGGDGEAAAAEAEEAVRKYEAEVTVAAKTGDHETLLRVVKEHSEAGVLPTRRVYQVLLSMYYEEARRARDAELSRELAEVTFSKARARGCVSPAMWTLMMMCHATARDHRKARDLDHLREGDGVPVPDGDGYRAALRTALSTEKRGANPPAALLHDKEYLLRQQQLARQLQRDPL